MKILIAALSSAQGPDGVGRHTINLARCLLNHPEVTQVDLVIGSWQQPSIQVLEANLNPKLRVHIARTQASSVARNIWYFKDLPGLARECGSHVVHLAFPVPVNRAQVPCPVVVTLHDFYPHDVPANFGYPKVLLNRLILRQCLDAVDAIACVSESTLNRLMTYRPAHAAKAVSIANSVEPSGRSEPVPSLTDIAFVLTVAQHRRNKNLTCTVSVFKRVAAERPKLRLVIVGNQGPETHGLKALIDASSLTGKVILLQGISESQLQWCYQHCALLLATSTHEGFGLPIAEAMLSGSPVVCSDIPSFRELGEGYCHLLPLSFDALADGVRSALAEPRPETSALPHLSAPVVASQYLRLYHRLLAARPKHIVSPHLLNNQKSGAA